MKELIFHRLFLRSVETLPDKVGIRDGDYAATYADHAQRVLKFANALGTELGVKKGDRIAILAANSHNYVELYQACFLGAGVINPLNLRLAPTELAYILNNSGTDVIFVDAAFSNVFEQCRGDVDVRTTVLIGHGDVPHDVTFEDLVAAGEPQLPEEPEETDTAVLMYTGGTTGLPKGVVLSQRAEMLNIYHIALITGLLRDDTFLLQTPMFHGASMPGLIGVPAGGGTLVTIPFFEPGAVIDVIERREVTMTTMVPTMISLMMQHADFKPERIQSLETLTYGASPMPASLMEKIRTQLPDVKLIQGYGMTEASAILTLLTDEDHRRGGELLTSAGQPVLGVQLSIQDPEGKPVPPGEAGEVCARAGNFMDEYWQDPEATSEVFRNGWYHTGDMGHVNAEGYLFLSDRVKDMIVSGGENVYSIEVENAISTNPKVMQVAVIGIPDETWGEKVHAVVVPEPGVEVTEDEIKDWARKTIAGFKVPKSVEFRAEPLPMSGAMKPLKRELREPHWKGHERAVH